MSEAPVAERPTVLVVDDEEDLRDIMRRMLERRGSYLALAAGDQDEATGICREHPGKIDVLITDLTLPGASERCTAAFSDMLRGPPRLMLAPAGRLAFAVTQSTAAMKPE